MRLTMLRALIVAIFIFFLGMSYAQADTLGQQATFNVNEGYDSSDRTSLTATLRHVSEHAYFYVDDATWATFSPNGQNLFLEDLEKLAQEFDTTIWPKERDFYGLDPEPGVDGDSRVVVLLEPLKRGNGGYFDPVHSYPRTTFSESNERDMIVISISALTNPTGRAFLAHEFQHLISLNQKELQRAISEDVWLNELRSEYANTLVGYNQPFSGSSLESRANAFLRQPSDSLTEWPNVSQDYAPVALFGEYLAGRYGQNIIRESMQIPSKGIDSLNRYFANHQLSERFPDVFSDWMLANAISDGSIRFSYANPDLRNMRVTPQYRQTVRGSTEHLVFAALKDWQPAWQEFTIADANVGVDTAVKLAFAGEAGQNFLVSYVVFYADGSYDVERMTVQGNRTAYVLSGDLFGSAEPGDQPISKILVAATKTQKTEQFGSNEVAGELRTSLSVVSKESVQAAAQGNDIVFNARAQMLRDGALIKRNNGEQEIYVIWGKYKRYLSPEVIKLYGHLDAANAIAVNNEIFNSYTTSNYIRTVDQKPVYATWPDNTKHWLNITAAQWDASGRDWNAIFTINDLEANFYKTGVQITN